MQCDMGWRRVSVWYNAMSVTKWNDLYMSEWDLSECRESDLVCDLEAWQGLLAGGHVWSHESVFTNVMGNHWFLSFCALVSLLTKRNNKSVLIQAWVLDHTPIFIVKIYRKSHPRFTHAQWCKIHINSVSRYISGSLMKSNHLMQITRQIFGVIMIKFYTWFCT